ncbi:lipid-binding protein, partial [Dysgonomonas gadei]|uniref:lipid-binding protein n=1 Tax=Dysgonomonas gadei TaxID=156974 RepID=UPI003AF0905B
FAALVFTSCLEEKDNWYTETAALDGRYVVATTCAEYSSDNTAIEDGEEAMIYNSAANVKDEIWIETHVAGAAVKGKFKITGDASAFKGATAEAKNVSTLLSYIYVNGNFYNPATYAKPTAVGQLIDGIQLYTRITLVEGKVTPKSATTIGGNISDGVYIKTIMHHDYVQFIGYQTSEDDWEDPNVPEFAWQLKAGSNTPADSDGMDETWTLEGYRYTGYPEDAAH